MATTRLRKAFRYPEDSGDDEHDREELDEEEQERVIEKLQIENEKRNAEYSMTFSAIPLLSTLIFLPSMLGGSSALSEWFLSFLSIASLCTTAFTMAYLPLQRPDRKGKKPVYKTDYTTSVRKALIPANSAICTVLVLVFAFASGDRASQNASPVLYLVPGALGVIMVVREVMLSVDIKHLEGLRYDFKGA